MMVSVKIETQEGICLFENNFTYIEQFVKKCSICMKLAPPVREPTL